MHHSNRALNTRETLGSIPGTAEIKTKLQTFGVLQVTSFKVIFMVVLEYQGTIQEEVSMCALCVGEGQGQVYVKWMCLSHGTH